jgi:diguanylate cyclase (GGDEF)-like protein
VLSLLLPILLYGFEKSQKWLTLGECVVILQLFDVASGRTGSPFMASAMETGIFTVLSMLQYAVMASSILYMQSYSLKHEQKVDQSTQKLQNLAIRDGMTGAFNRTFMEGLIGDAINRSKRSKSPLSLLMIDVDNFKQINDTRGHHAGDEVLTSLVKLIDSSKRLTDYLGRWGGDELVLLLTDTSLQGAELLAEKLRARVDGTVFLHHSHLTISLGASTYQEGENIHAFLERADAAMYNAKRLGRNRVASRI